MDRLAVFEKAPLVAVAVSGGPDSLALAILADRWARRRDGEIRALTVDHRLRQESSAEIKCLGDWLAARRIHHEILVWEGPKPCTGVQEAARRARYGLLEAWCQSNGCLHLLIAHHRDDQLETRLLREDAKSGCDGLAAMSAVRELQDCRLLRPLLDVPKARLLATLVAEGQPFLTDPSNRNPVFARARLREDWLAAPDEADRLLADVRRLGRARVQREAAVDALLARAASVHSAGFAVLDRGALLAAPGDIAVRALAALVWTLGGADYPPRRAAVARLLQTLGGAARGYVLGGCRFLAWRGRVLVLRELAAAALPVRLAPGASLVWDRRFAVASPPEARPLRLGYLGLDGVVELHCGAPATDRRRLPALLHPVLPALWDEKGIAGVPALRYQRNQEMVLPSLFFRPVNSLSHASFSVVWLDARLIS